MARSTRHSRSDTRSTQQSSSAISPIKLSSTTFRARHALSELIRSTSKLIDRDPFFFLIRGDCWKSLSRHASLSAESYSALLLASELVTTKGNGVCLSVETWKEFIVTYDLAPRGKQSCGISEICSGGVVVEAVKKQHHDNPPIDKNGKMKHLHMLRIGEYDQGSTITATKQINNETPPPSFNHKLRTLQCAFLLMQ